MENVISEEEFKAAQVIIAARKESGLTQQQLSKRTGIAQAEISKFESGQVSPSLKTMKRLAAGMDMKLNIEFRPITQG